MRQTRASQLSAAESQALGLRLREELARRRLTRQGLADAAKISISTLEKVLAGKRTFTLATIVRLEEGLGVDLRPAAANAPSARARTDSAPDELGSYGRAAVAWLEGAFLTLRPSFGVAGAVYAYRTDIRWDQATSRLVFREAERMDSDFTQFGSVAVPHQSGHIYLITNRHGQHRMIVVARPTINGEMHGILTTLRSGTGAHLSPVAAPIVLAPLKAGELAAFGRIAKDHPAHGRYARLLQKTLTDQFAAFVTGGR